MNTEHKFRPINRHILVNLPATKELDESSLVLLPEDYKKPEQKYSVVQILAIADDVNFECSPYDELIIDTQMLEEIEINDNMYHIVLENYVVGIIEKER